MILTYEMLKEIFKDYKAPDMKITRMANDGRILKLRKDLYETNLNVEGYKVSNAICSPSYLSFDFVLSYYGLIPEKVSAYTNATFRQNKKKVYKNKLGLYLYQDVPSDAFPFGIKVVKDNSYSLLMATPEKALCDKLYSLSPVKNKKELYNLLFQDLRVDMEAFKSLDMDQLLKLCNMYKCTNLKILKKVVGDFVGNNTKSND